MGGNGSGSFTDADYAGHTFTAMVNYGDGTIVPLTLHGKTFTLSHTYATILTPYTITVTVTDNTGVSGSASITVIVLL